MITSKVIALFFLSSIVTHIHSAQDSNQPAPPRDIWSEANSIPTLLAWINKQ